MSGLRWDNEPRDFTGLASAVFALGAPHWQALGAQFVSDNDPEFPRRLATGRIATQFDATQRFAIFDEGDVTTLLVSGGERWAGVAGTAVVLAMASEGFLSLEDDVLQTAIGSVQAGDPSQSFAYLESKGSSEIRQLVASAAAKADELSREALRVMRQASPLAEAATLRAASAAHARGHEDLGPTGPYPLMAEREQPPQTSRVVRFLARLGGGYEPLLAYTPSEQTGFAIRGIAVATAGLIWGLAVASVSYDWLAVPLVLAIVLGIVFSVITVSFDRFVVDIRRQSSARVTIALAAPRLVLSVAIGLVAAEILQLLIFRTDILAQARVVDPHHTPGLLDALTVLRHLAATNPTVQIARVLLDILIMLIVAAPVLFATIAAVGRPSLYEQLQEITASHLIRRVTVEEDLFERAHELAATVRAAEVAEREMNPGHSYVA